MRRVLAVIYLFLLGSMPATAQTLRVLAGDHGDFVRVVFHANGGPYRWQVVQSGQDIEIDSGVATARFDLSSLFARIPRDRIQTATDMGSGKLRLQLACDCEFRDTAWRNAGLYLDIRDAVKDESVPMDEQNPLVTPPPPEPVALPLFLSPPFKRQQQPMVFEQEVPEEPFDTTLLEQGLIAAIAGAAEQGFLRVSPDVAQIPLPVDPDANPTPGIDLRAHTAQAVPEVTTIASSCIDTSWVDVADWATSTDLSAAIATRRQALVAANGQFSRSAILALARTYAAHGLGIEAQATLDLDGISSRERDVLIEIARFVEGDAGTYPILSAQTGCPGFSGLLGYLTADPPSSLGRSEVLDLVETAGLWPETEHKAQILEQLWQRLGTQGLLAAADLVQPETVQANPPPPKSEPAAEIEQLLSEAGTMPEPDAQVILDLADSLAFEVRETDAADPIVSSQMNALLDMGRYHDAERMIMTSWGTEYGNRVVEEAFLSRAATESPDDNFLQIAFDWSPYGHDATTRRAFATRLEALGFSNQAALWHPDSGGALPVLHAPEPAVDLPPAPPEENLSPPGPLAIGRSALSASEALRSELLELTLTH